MKLDNLILAASLGVAAAPGAWAGIIYDNLGNTPLTEALYEKDTWAASRFTTDGQDYSLKTVVLRMYRSGPSTAQMDIYSDFGNLPGTTLGTLISPGAIPLNTAAEVTFTTAGISLPANSSYWVVLRAPTGQLWWSYTDNTSGSGSGFSTVNTFTDDAGTSWNTPDSALPNLMQVNADISSVPEPSQWAMMGMTLLGAGGFALRQWRNLKA